MYTKDNSELCTAGNCNGVAGSGGELRREGFCSWDVESGRRGLKAASVGTDWLFELNVWSSQLFPL